MHHTLQASFVLAVCLASPGLVFGQALQPMAKPEELGLMIPRGQKAIEVTDRNVLLAVDEVGDEAGEGQESEPVVAKVYLEIGDRFIVTMPNGLLRSVAKRDTIETDRPFEPAEKDDIAKELRRQFRGFKTRETRRYLCVYNTSDEFCESKTAILETMYPMLVANFKRQGLSVETPDIPLIVVMFRTKAEFQKYRQMPDSMLAYYNAVSNRVFLYQFSDLVKDAPMIAVKQSTSTIAHEGVHQVLHNIGVQKRLSNWPIWLSEGLAEYFSPTTTSRSKWSGVGKPNPLRMRELFQHIRKTGIGNGTTVQHVVGTERLSSTEYAVAWALTHYLATKKKKDLFAYIREVSEIAPLEQPGDELMRFINYFGADFAKLEREMIKHIRGLPYRDPVLHQPYFLLTARSGNRKLATITSSLDHSAAQLKMIAKLKPAQRRKVRFFPVRTYKNRKLAEQAMKLYLR